MNKISENNQKKILEYIKWLLSKLQLLADALMGNSFDTFDYQARIEIIASILIVDGKISLPKEVIREMVTDILWSLKREKNDKPNWSQIYPKILSSISNYEKQPLKEYLILFPLFIKKKRNIKVIRIMDTNFSVSNWRKIKKFPGWKELVSKFELIEPNKKGELEKTLLTKFTPLLVKLKAKNYQDAFEKSSKDFEILRSAINLVIEYGIFHSIFFTSKPNKPLGKCLPPKIYGIFREDGGFKQIAYIHKEYNYLSTEATNTDTIPYATKLLLRTKNLKKELKDIATSALIRYGQAMDTTDWSVSFLALWQVLELLSLRNIVEKNLSMAEVQKRIGKLVKDEPYFDDILDIITQSRHSLVHKGEFSEEGYRDVNFIKIFSENAIGNFISLSSKFQSIPELDMYYESSTKNSHDLLAQKRRLHAQQNAISKLLKDRNI